MTHIPDTLTKGTRWRDRESGTVVTVTELYEASDRFENDYVHSVGFSPSIVFHTRYVRQLTVREFLTHMEFASTKLAYSVGDLVQVEDWEGPAVIDAVMPDRVDCYSIAGGRFSPDKLSDAPMTLQDLSGWALQSTAPPPGVKEYAKYIPFRGGYQLTVHTKEAVPGTVRYFVAPDQRPGLIGVLCKKCGQETLTVSQSETGAHILTCTQCEEETVVRT